MNTQQEISRAEELAQMIYARLIADRGEVVSRAKMQELAWFSLDAGRMFASIASTKWWHGR